MTDSRQHAELMGVLRTILKVQALSAVQHLETKKDKVAFLNEGGLSHAEVSEIVGISADRVRKTVFSIKKKLVKDE